MKQPDRTIPPVTGNICARLSLPEPKCVILDNGISLHVLDCGDTPVNRLTAIFNGGLAEAGDHVTASICMQIMREGCSAYSGGAIAELLDFNGAWIKGLAQTHHTSMSMYSLNSKIYSVLPVFHDIIRNPTFPLDEFETMRESAATNAEIAQQKVDVRSQQLIMQMVFGATHPLALISGPENIRALDLSAVTAFHDTYIAHAKPTLYLSGRIDQHIIDAVNQVFGKDECICDSNLTVDAIHPMPDDVKVLDISNSKQCSIRMAVPTITREHPDYIDLRCAIIGLGGYFGSRLMAEVRERQGLTYGISAALFGYPEAGVMMIASQTDNTTAKALIQSAKYEIERLQSEPMNDDEFERLRRYIRSQLLSTMDSPFAIMDYYETLKLNFIADGYFQRQIEALDRMTPERLSYVMAKYIDLSKMKIAVAGDKQTLIL